MSGGGFSNEFGKRELRFTVSGGTTGEFYLIQMRYTADGAPALESVVMLEVE